MFASWSAHAFATAEFGASLPGILAQPPRSINCRRCHAAVFRNSASWMAASGCFMKFSTQMGVSTATDMSIRQIQGALQGRVSRSVVGEIVKRVREQSQEVSL